MVGGVKVSVRLKIGRRHYAAFNSLSEMVHMQGRLVDSLLATHVEIDERPYHE